MSNMIEDNLLISFNQSVNAIYKHQSVGKRFIIDSEHLINILTLFSSKTLNTREANFDGSPWGKN